MSDQMSAEETWTSLISECRVLSRPAIVYGVRTAVRAEIRESEARMMDRIAALEGRGRSGLMGTQKYDGCGHVLTTTTGWTGVNPRCCPSCLAANDTPDALPEGAEWDIYPNMGEEYVLLSDAKARERELLEEITKLRAECDKVSRAYEYERDRHASAFTKLIEAEKEIEILRAELAESRENSRPRRVTQEEVDAIWIAFWEDGRHTMQDKINAGLRAAGLILPGDTAPSPRAEKISREELERLFRLFITELGENGYSGDIKNALAAVLRELGKEVESA